MNFSKKLKLATQFITFVIIALGFGSKVFAESTKSELNSIVTRLKELEKKSGGKIGLSAVHTGSNTRLRYQGDERFPLCSTFKAVVVAAVLKKSIKESGLLQQHVAYEKKDIPPGSYSPITEKHTHEGMSVAQLCEAAIAYSDDTAANLLMKKLGDSRQ